MTSINAELDDDESISKFKMSIWMDPSHNPKRFSKAGSINLLRKAKPSAGGDAVPSNFLNTFITCKFKKKLVTHSNE